MQADGKLIDQTADIVTAFISRNNLPPSELPSLIKTIHAALANIDGTQLGAPAKVEVNTPAVSVKRSITPDFLICLEDGLKFKSLKRHLLSKYGMSPDDYRAKWNLPRDYPMVAPAYSAVRSAMAKAHNLGASGKTRKAAAPKGSVRRAVKKA